MRFEMESKVHVTGSNTAINKSLEFKWRRLEVRAHYPLSFKPCATGFGDFSVVTT